MKNTSIKILLFCFIILMFSLPFLGAKVLCEPDNQSVYARIENDNVFLYSAPSLTTSNELFIIPKSYFVVLTGNAGDEQDLFYSCYYSDITGYIKKSDVKPVIGTPTNPFASNLSFRVFSPSGLDLRSSPNSSTPFNLIISVGYLETNLVYYGSISGEEKISQKGSEWYYCKYIKSSLAYYGYLYGALCDLLPPIPVNTEVLEYKTGELFAPDKPVAAPNQPSLSLTDSTKIIIIVASCIPCFLLIYLLFKPTKLLLDNGTAVQPKKKISKLKKSEYYEYNDH